MKLPNLIAATLATGVVFAGAEPPKKWIQSFDAGYFDGEGKYLGGSEIMHLVSHQGKLFAANGYWVDARWVIPPDAEKQSAQVLRLDSSDGGWQVDLDMGKSNGLGLRYMKGNILKSVIFRTDGEGKPLPEPVNLLVMAAGANFEGGGAVSAWVREDTGDWTHALVRHGSSAGGVRWVPRDMEVYRDKVTGVERLIMSLGNPGIVSGVYDPSVPGSIRWGKHLEYPFLTKGNFRTRPLGMAQANGTLLFSEGGSIFRRIDGDSPSYELVLDLNEDTDTDVGGIRGLTAIGNPNGDGESLLFLWAPGKGAKSEVKRLDPDGAGGYVLHEEAEIMGLMRDALGADVTYTLGAHNMMYPFTDPITGETAHFIGFQGNIRGKDHLRWKGSALYGGAMYAIRRADQTYSVNEVNNAYAPGKPVLVSPRAFCLSPFGDGNIFIGGHDSSRKISDDMAWIFKAPLEVAFGVKPGADADPARPPIPIDKRLTDGPLYELRIYSASEGRFQHLIKRFREHTDRIFEKHGLEAVGYWVPTDGSVKKRRRFVYILKHPSRYAAYQNWTRFSNDREWESVLDQPEFQGLLSEKPTSIFMTENGYAEAVKDGLDAEGGIFELRTYTTRPDKLTDLNARIRQHAARIFRKHGMLSMGYWTPFDQPESQNTLIHLVHHAGREEADANWKAFNADPDWQKVVRDSEAKGEILAEPPAGIYLRALDFSPMR